MYNGIINVYKEKGYTSFDVVARLRGILHQKKIGHTGTLDPDAEGVLPVCLGQATKLVQILTDKTKEYICVMRLGVRTDTEDMSGEILDSCEDIPDEESVREAVLSFIGEIDQIPPMYSAIKQDGKRLYELARAGEVVERKARRIKINGIDIQKVELPLVTMKVDCGSGTYIRSLCRDIGDKLGCGAAMQSLIRTRSGAYNIDDALKLEQIEELAAEDKEGLLKGKLITMEDFFSELPAVRSGEKGEKKLKNGNALYPEETETEAGGYTGKVRMYDTEGHFTAVYDYDGKLYKCSLFLGLQDI
ncbi:MAG: tRNA pseudouridine(55) synthase TruB [Lachnospiraceae bacterium]|nr:tRNA pseudouridine(55) synthase TruB [Lachnospiraceae bacterium]